MTRTWGAWGWRLEAECLLGGPIRPPPPAPFFPSGCLRFGLRNQGEQREGPLPGLVLLFPAY